MSTPGPSDRQPSEGARWPGVDIPELGTAAIIVHFQTRDLTEAAVRSALAEPEVAEVVVVDNASADGSAEHLERAFHGERVRVLRSAQNRGYGPGANVGVAASTAPLILILNSDATLRPGAVKLLAEELVGDPTLGVIAPAVYDHDGSTLQSRTYGRLPRRREIVLRRWSTKAGAADVPRHRDPEWVSGVAMLLRRADFDSVGGFDERFNMYFEDLDLCRRLRERGKSARRIAAAGVVHIGGRSWRARSDQVRSFHESKLRYFEKVGATRFDLRCVRVLGRIRTRMSQLPARHGTQ